MNYKGKALAIAGSDSSGGAGIQADLKTFQAFDVYGMSVITSVTAQNTLKVKAIYDIPKEMVALQIDSIFEDIEVDAVKTGMLSNEEIIETVADKLSFYKVEKIVVDPVMVSKSNAKLLKGSAEKRFIDLIIPLAFLITPNIPEAELISGVKIENVEDMKISARKIREIGARNVLIKGGHLEENVSTDVLFDGIEFYLFEEERIPSKNTHGTGCTLSSAITACLARGENLYNAIRKAKQYITIAIREAPNNIGKGFGPLYHNIRGIV